MDQSPLVLSMSLEEKYMVTKVLSYSAKPARMMGPQLVMQDGAMGTVSFLSDWKGS